LDYQGFMTGATRPDSSGIAVLCVGVGCERAAAIRTDSGPFLCDSEINRCLLKK